MFGVDDPHRFRVLRNDLASGISYRVALLLWFPSLWHRNGRLNPLRDVRQRRARLLRMLSDQMGSTGRTPTWRIPTMPWRS